MNVTRCFSLVAATALALPAPAVIVRHDREDAAHRALAERLPASGRFERMGGGTLIGPRDVLTAAHVARAVRDRRLAFEMQGMRFEVAAVLLHPQWSDAGPGSPHDLALVRLVDAPAVTPMPICATAGVLGDAVLLAGSGDFGTGLTGARLADGQHRAAQNRVHRRDDTFLVLRFEAPDKAQELEGIGGPGDSGGGLFRDDERPCLLGVSAWGDGDGHGPGRYGALDGYTDAVAEAAWIRDAATRLPKP